MYAIGLDFGTNSARGLLVDIIEGVEVVDSVCNYPSGVDGIILDEKNHHLARQNPADYHLVTEQILKDLVVKAGKHHGFSPEKIIGIGVDTTGSTPLPVDSKLVPLSFYPEFRENNNAMAFLWKDHTAHSEAMEITELAERLKPAYLSKIGGVYSSEWFWAKLLYLARTDRKVFDAMDSFVEICDYIPAILCGKKRASEVVRGVCAAGHKAMYSEDWGGLPGEDFLGAFSPSLAGVREKLYAKAYPAGTVAGHLCKSWAEVAGLPEGIPVSVGAFDAHMGAVGAGVRPGVLVKVIGTSSCDMAVASTARDVADIPGICGIVPHSIIPGFFGIEAGQSAVGDIFYWFVKKFISDRDKGHDYFTKRAGRFQPGQTGLLALDWHNGNRSILVDEKLTGLVVGINLHTRPEEIYRALVEATGFGARLIIERMEEYGVEISEIVATGGIPGKNPLLMQIYSDITQRRLRIAGSSQTCALGAAIFGAVAAGSSAGGFATVGEAQEKLCRFKSLEYEPQVANKSVYDKLYGLYKQLTACFGMSESTANMGKIMKELLAIKDEVVDG